MWGWQTHTSLRMCTWYRLAFYGALVMNIELEVMYSCFIHNTIPNVKMNEIAAYPI